MSLAAVVAAVAVDRRAEVVSDACEAGRIAASAAVAAGRCAAVDMESHSPAAIAGLGVRCRRQQDL